MFVSDVVKFPPGFPENEKGTDARSQWPWTLSTKIRSFIVESKWMLVPILKEYPQSIPEMLDEMDGQLKNIIAPATAVAGMEA